MRVRDHIQRSPHGWRNHGFNSLTYPNEIFHLADRSYDRTEDNLPIGITIEPNYILLNTRRNREDGLEVPDTRPNAETLREAYKKADEENKMLEDVISEEDLQFEEWRASMTIKNTFVEGKDTISVYFSIGSLEEVCREARELMKTSTDPVELQEIGEDMIDQICRDLNIENRLRDRFSIPRNIVQTTQILAVTEDLSFDDLRKEIYKDKDPILNHVDGMEDRLEEIREKVEEVEVGVLNH